MRVTKMFVRFVLIGIVVVLIGGLAAWYVFLRAQATTITAQDAARGYGAAAPAQNAIKDAYNAIVSSISSLVGATSTAPTGTGSQLWHITRTPVAGMGFVGSGASEKLRFAERATGYLFEVDPRGGAITRLTNRLFPKTYEAVFSRDGSVILRSLDERGGITSFAGTVASSSSEAPDAQTLAGAYLARGLRTVLPGSSARELLYLTLDQGGGTTVIRSLWDGSGQKKVFSSPLSDWKLTALSDGRIFLAQNPADGVPGYAYEIKDGALAPQAGGVPGLTFLPRAASSAALFGESGNGTLAFSVRTRADAAPVTLPIKTVADKCVWVPPPSAPVKNAKAPQATGPQIAYCAVPQYIPSANFLDEWYRGAVHVADSWWRIDAASGDVELVHASGAANESFDVEGPVIDDSGTMIAFMNAADKSLWLLRIGADASTASTTPR